jgi:DNA-binding MarR family transcriptional regulator
MIMPGDSRIRSEEPGPFGSDDLALGNVLFDVWLASRAATALIDEAVRDAGLNADEFAIYSVLAASDGMSPTDLAQWMAAPATTVSSYVGRFERRGHIRRLRNPADRRSYLVELNGAGRAAHLAAGLRFGPVLSEVNRRLGADALATHERLVALHEVIRRDAGHPPSGPITDRAAATS